MIHKTVILSEISSYMTQLSVAFYVGKFKCILISFLSLHVSQHCCLLMSQPVGTPHYLMTGRFEVAGVMMEESIYISSRGERLVLICRFNKGLFVTAHQKRIFSLHVFQEAIKLP